MKSQTTWLLTEEDKETYLIGWWHKNQDGGYANMEDFDPVWKTLFGSYPTWYNWKNFYRDHGCVGLR